MRNARGHDRHERVPGQHHHQQSGAGCESGEEQTLGQQLTRQAHARGAESRAHRHLAGPHRRARHQQAGNTGAADDQHQRNDGAEEMERSSHVRANERITQRLDVRAPGGAVLRIDGRCAGRDLVQPRLSRRQRHAGAKLGDREQAPSAPTDRCRTPQRSNDVSLEDRLHSIGNDADDRHRLSVERDRAAEDQRGAGELLPPVSVGDERDWFGIRRRVGIDQHAPGDRRLGEEAEHLRFYQRRSDPAAVGLSPDSDTPRLQDRNPLEDVLLHPPIAGISPRHGHARKLLVAHVNPHQLRGLRIGNRLQPDGVGDAEKRRVDADAQGERDDDHG